VPFADHRDAVAELDHAHAFAHLGILYREAAALKGMAVREGKAHHPTSSTDRDTSGR